MPPITASRSALRVCLTALALLSAGCGPVGPDFVRPEPEAPDAWSQTLEQGLEAAEFEPGAWWQVFDDPILDDLVAAALENNNSLEIAGLTVLEARAQLGIATGARYPQLQVAAGDATWTSPPENSITGSDYWQYSLGASVAWEVDFWGRFQRGVESADAAYLASIAAYHQAQVLLVAAVVDVYAAIRTTEEQLRIANENARLQRRSYDITEVKFRNGADSELDVQQAKTLLLATEASVPALEAALRQARNALSVLLGQSPGSVTTRLEVASGLPDLPDDVAIGLPADLLRRRPDVRRSEMLAMAQNARVGLAAADLYPSFSLSGSIGLTAGGPGDGDFGDLFSSDALGVTVGPSFVWPFLNYGRIRNNVRVQDARLQQALVNYRETVLQAAREAEDAIAAYMGARAQAEILAQTVASARRSNELSTLRYREGLSGYQRVLDSQQSLFTQQQRYIGARGESVRSLVALYKALGAGWQYPQDPPYIGPESRKAMQDRTNWGDLLDASAPAGANE